MTSEENKRSLKSNELDQILKKLEEITTRQNEYQNQWLTAQEDHAKNLTIGAFNFGAEHDVGLQGRRLSEISGMISDIKALIDDIVVKFTTSKAKLLM